MPPVADETPEQLLELVDERIGLRGWIAIDSTALGPAFGGIRRTRYPDDDAAIADARRLSRAMRDKCVLAGLPAGGAKSVLRVVRDDSDWRAIYRAVGRAVEALAGRYVCGPDVGTGPAELAWVRETTQYCNPIENDASRSTAAGVLAAMRAVWDALALEPRHATVVVQGLGGVGGRVARGLVELGARVLAADPDAAAGLAAAQAGVEIIAPEAVSTTACDVFSPNALGFAIDGLSATSWPTRAICGAANNALGPGADEVLHARGILVVPDPIASAGAVIEGVLTVREGESAATRARIAETIAAIELTAATVLAAAAAENRPSSVVARALARTLLDSAARSRA